MYIITFGNDKSQLPQEKINPCDSYGKISILG